MSMESAIASVFGTIYNNAQARKLTAQDRWENHMYGEWAAEKADLRTRQLYSDFYSPQALMSQYKEAGLSPAMMFGGTPGQGGMSGAQGTGAAGLQTPYMPISILEAAQVANINAQTDKTKAETQNIYTDTYLKQLQQDWQEWLNKEKTEEMDILWGKWKKEDTGEPTSLYQLAQTFESYEDFLQMVERQKGSLSEIQRRALGKIWTSAYTLDREVSILTADKLNADFSASLVNALMDKDLDYAKKSATATVQYLEHMIEENKLEKDKKATWNRLLKKIEAKSKSGKDVVLILSMIADRIMTQYHMPNITPTTNNTYNTSKTVEINK